MQVRMRVLQGAQAADLCLHLPTVIGRGGDSKLKLPASTVSRHHCEIYEYEGQIVVRDLDSSNGTIVNGHKIKGPTFLTAEDDLTIGPITARLEVVDSSEPVIVKPAPVPEFTPAAVAQVEEVAPVEEAAQGEVAPVEEVAQGEVAPTFEELPADSSQPDKADALVEDAGFAIDIETRSPAEGGSVLQYTPNDKVGRSFVGIVPSDEVPAADNVSADEVSLEDVGDSPTVESDDSALNDFFNNLD